MRKVLGSHKAVAHVWAHQGQSEGRASNVFFKGDTIFSYGRHFPMGKIVVRGGRTVALITTHTYSNSTAKHVNYVRRATSHLPRFSVPLTKDSHNGLPLKAREMFDSYQPRVLDHMQKAGRARLHREWHVSEAQRLVQEANRFAEFFGLKPRLSMPASIEAAMEEAKRLDAAAAKRESARLTRERKAREKREAEQRAEAMEDAEKWRKGELDYIRHSRTLPTVVLRLSEDRKEVETSEGATVPVAHAERAYRIGLRYKARHEEYHRNGHTVRVGHYAVDSMDNAGHVKIGCHDIEWAEIERLAREAGWDNTPAPEGAEGAEAA